MAVGCFKNNVYFFIKSANRFAGEEEIAIFGEWKMVIISKSYIPPCFI